MIQIRCTFKIVGKSPLGFSAPIKSKKNTGETHDAFEDRTWRERIHTDPKGEAFLLPMALKNCLGEVAKYLSETVPGKGKATYTKHFEAGIAISEPLRLGVQAVDIPPSRLFVPSDGVRGSGSRVWKNFPTLADWSTSATVSILDPVIKAEKLKEYLTYAGEFIGMGYFRPRRNGYWVGGGNGCFGRSWPAEDPPRRIPPGRQT